VSQPAAPVLDVRNLQTWFHTDDGVVKAVDDVSFTILPGRTLGVVGESGSGKSVTALTVMRLLPDRAARIAGGSVSFLGRDVVGASQRDMAEVRGRDVAMIFQEPMTSLNPVIRVGDQVAEAIVRHEKLGWAEARRRAVSLFAEVGIPSPELSVHKWPHEMSGGQKQRVMIAMALACNPKLLVADEPTTALDVTIQAQILTLLRELAARRGMACLFITHDLGVIAKISHEVAVMYRGRLVEYGPVEQVFARPRHPYTKGLLACRPKLDSPWRRLPTVDDFMETREVDGRVEIIEKELTLQRTAELRGVGVAPPAPDEGPPPARGHGSAGPLPQTRGLRVRQGVVARRGQRVVQRASRPHAGARRGVGLRQDHDRPDPAPPAARGGGPGGVPLPAPGGR
jgi:peptide/nickel transport system ATP-binding protein